MTFAKLIMEDALINEITNQRRLLTAAVVNKDDSEAQKVRARIYELKIKIKHIKEERTMTRTEELTAMRMQDLEEIAKELGVKINKKGSKAKAIEKILEAEAEQVETEPEEITEAPRTTREFLEAVSDVLDGKKRVNRRRRTPSEAPTEPIETTSEEPKQNVKAETKRANLKLTELTYKGETKSIREWADEIAMPWPTLYDRVNRNGWSVEDAIETPLGQRRPK